MHKLFKCTVISFTFMALPYLTAQNKIHSEVQILENFDANTIMSNNPRLGGNAVIVSAADEVKGVQLNISDFGNDSRFAKLNADVKGTTELILKYDIKTDVNSILSFRCRTEIARQAAQTFSIFIDDVEKPLTAVLGTGWRTERLTLDTGNHKIRFEVKSLRGAKVQGGYNAVYIDDICVFPDKIVSIAISPRGEQQTYLNAPQSEKIKFSAEALLPDGSPKIGVGECSLSVTGGEINDDGVWTPDAAGTFFVTAELGRFAAKSSQIKVHEANISKKPFYYSGTGKTYSGYIGGDSAKNAAEMPSRESLVITNPRVADFDADAFFLLEGVVRRPSGRNYARVLIQKMNTKPVLETFYIVEGSFSKRIWLPFGAGKYVIEVLEFDKVTITTPQKGPGAFRGGAYSQEPLVFTVNNIRSETIVEGGQHWLYPSFNVQSDDFRITNLLNHITFEIKDTKEKIAAIHDYLVRNLAYDNLSFSNPMHARKMDAISVIQNSGGVCEGYAWLSAALLRAAGIPCRLVANRSIMHLWNQVWVSGSGGGAAGAWKFYDATWDDPFPPDKGQDVVRRTYFLLDSLTGGDNRHRGAGTVIVGDVE